MRFVAKNNATPVRAHEERRTVKEATLKAFLIIAPNVVPVSSNEDIQLVFILVESKAYQEDNLE